MKGVRMVKLNNIEVTNPELNALEDLIFAWILCRKHLVKSANKDDVEIFKMQNSCKTCRKEKDRIKKRCFRLWKKLVRAYDKVR